LLPVDKELKKSSSFFAGVYLEPKFIAGNSVSQPEEAYGFEMLANGSTYDVDILPPPRVIGFEAVDRFPIA
jgi:hypothetical protein